MQVELSDDTVTYLTRSMLLRNQLSNPDIFGAPSDDAWGEYQAVCRALAACLARDAAIEKA